jgi:L-ascorbate metabolism protein UlaG (beta-lactamase superfamily)
MKIISENIKYKLHDLLNQPADGFYFYWLGQAGFAFTINNTNILIDPYLSDSLSEKYRGSLFRHTRMMDVPVELSNLSNINWVICTHRHTDHMDAVTLTQIHINNPLCQFLIPKAWVQRVCEFNIPKELIIPINAGEYFSIEKTITIEPIPSAHEELEKDAENNYLYLGYIIKTSFANIYHSGDCIPYPGLIEQLSNKKIDIAFLPVSGRDFYRKQNGVPGNFSIDEAIEVCIQSGIPHLVCHHFGMFSFNTVDEKILYKKKEECSGKPNIIIPEIKKQYQII